MATGDIRGNLERLRVQLLSIAYPHAFDVQGLKQGIPAVLLPLLHYALLGYSRHVARYLSANGYELYAKSDLRFMEGVMKFLRAEFNYRSALTIPQVFSRGYAERKVLFVHDVIQMCKRKHSELLRIGRQRHYAKQVTFTQINYDNPGTHIAGKSSRICEDPSIVRPAYQDCKSWHSSLRNSRESDSATDLLLSGEHDSNGDHHQKERCVGSKGGNEVRRIATDVRLWNFLGESVPPCEEMQLADCQVAGDDDYTHSELLGKAETPTSAKHATIPSPVKAGSPRVAAVEENAQGYHRDRVFENQVSGLVSEGLCQKILNVAERLEARFQTLEDGVTRAHDMLQEKLNVLEGRIYVLETNRACEGRTQGNNQRNDYGMYQMASACKRCSHEDFHKPQLNEELTGPQPHLSHAVRDISNTHQCIAKNVTSQNLPKFCTLHQQLKSNPNTQEFIDGIKARFSRTMELFGREEVPGATLYSHCAGH